MAETNWKGMGGVKWKRRDRKGKKRWEKGRKKKVVKSEETDEKRVEE